MQKASDGSAGEKRTRFEESALLSPRDMDSSATIWSIRSQRGNSLGWNLPSIGCAAHYHLDPHTNLEYILAHSH